MAKNANGASYYEIRIDNAQLRVDAKQAESILAGIGNQAVAEGARIDNTFRKLILPAGVAIAAQQFARSLVQVRGEMKALEDSFEVLLSGKGVEGFISQLKQFAVDSPLSLPGVSNAAQTLLGFNVEAERVIPIIRQLGDVSMGNEEKFRSLALAYAQVHSTGKLMGQDLLQMINAGFNPLTVIAEKTGKSVGVLKEEMAAGAISAQMVADAFTAATAEGGKFYGMTQTQAEGIKGLEAQLEGAFQEAFNNIGKSQEGIITGSYKAAIAIVENYEKVGKIILGLVATYGAYKAAVIVATAAEKGWTVAQIAHYNVLLIVEKAQKLLNKTMLANPYVLLTMAVVALVGTMWALHDSTTAAEKAQKAHNDRLGEAKAKFDELISVVRDETKAITDRQEALENLRKLYPALFGDMDIEAVKLANLTDLTRQATQADRERARESAERRLAALERSAGSARVTIQHGSFLERGPARRRLAEIEEEIKAQKEILAREEELSKRAEEEAARSSIYGESYKAAQKEWAEAKRALTAIEKDKNAFTQKQYEDAKARVEAAKKAYADLGGDVSTGGARGGRTSDPERQAQERAALGREYENEVTQARIDAKADSLEKTLAQNALNFEREKRQIEEQYSDLAGFTKEQRQTLIDAAKATKNRAESTAITTAFGMDLDAETASWENYLAEYGNHEERKLAITWKYERLIAEAKTSGEKNSLKKQREKELQTLKRSAIEESEVWKRLFTDFSRISTESLLEIINQAEQSLAGATELSAEDIEELQERLEGARREIAQRNPFEALEKAYKKYQQSVASGDKAGADNAWVDVQNASQAIREQISELGNALSGIGNIFGEGIGDTVDKVVGSISNAVAAFENLGKSGQKSTGQVIQGISGIISIITTLIGSVVELQRKAWEENHNMFPDLYHNIGEALAYYADNLEYVRMVQSGALDDLLLYISEIEHALTFSAEVFKWQTPTGDKLYDDIRNLTDETSYLYKEAKKINKEFINLGYNAGRVFGDAKFDTVADQLNAISQQIIIVQNEIYELAIAERDAKSKERDRQDYKGRIKEAEKRLEELVQQGKDVLTNGINAVLGTTVEEISSKLGSALWDAFQQGTNAAEAWGKAVKDIVQDIAKNAVISKALEPQINAIIDRITGDWYGEEEKFIGFDKVLEDLPTLNQELMDLLGTVLPEFQKVFDQSGGASEAAREASAKGIATASQDSVDELNGRFTVIQGHTFSLNENVKTIVDMFRAAQGGGAGSGDNSPMASLQTHSLSIAENQKLLLANSHIALGHLSAIEMNTHELHAMRADIAEMRIDIRTTRQTVGDIKDKGVIMK